jgi:hypothetical protein
VALSALFAAYYGAALVLVAFELVGAGGWFGARPRFSRVARTSATPYVIGLVASYALALSIVWYAATHQSASALQIWRGKLPPLPVVTPGMEHPNVIAVLLLTVYGCQCALLWAVYRRTVDDLVLRVAAAAMLVLSLVTPAFISLDPYSYAADAYLGRAAYVAPIAPLPGELRVVSEAFAGAVPPAPYGPLWLLLTRAVTALIPSLLLKLLALRLLGALSLIAVAGAMARLGLPRRLLAIVWLNPGLALYYVMNAHNDLFAVACIAWAAAWIRRSVTASLIAILAAALIKLPFAVLALPVLQPIRSSRGRWACAVVIIIGALALSWLTGGREYFQALAVHAPPLAAYNVLNLAVAFGALAAVVTATAGYRRLRSAVWLMPMIGSYPTPWYFIWGFGYALARHRVLAYLLILFPLASALVDTEFWHMWTIVLVVPVLVALQVVTFKPSHDGKPR